MPGESVNESLAAPRSLSLSALLLTTLYYSQVFGFVSPCVSNGQTLAWCKQEAWEGRDRGRWGVLSRCVHGEKCDFDRDCSHWPSRASKPSEGSFWLKTYLGHYDIY